MELGELQLLVRELGITLALAVTVIVALVTLAWAFFIGRVQRLATEAVDRRLEKQRQQLQLDADGIRLDLQRRLADFGLVNSKRHGVYRRLYRRALQAEGSLGRLWGGAATMSYEDASKEDIATLLSERLVPGKVRESILARWDTESKAAIGELQKALREAKVTEAFRAQQRFTNEFLLSELYISPQVRDALERLNRVFASLSAFALTPSITSKEAFELKQTAKALVLEPRDAMVRDLSRGDYGAALNTKLPSPAAG